MRRVIVVIGEALVDLLVRSDGQVAATLGGGPFNTARTIARLGHPVAFLGRLSSDAFGRLLRDRLVADGVHVGLVDDTDLPTTIAVVEPVDGGSERYRFYVDGTSAPGLGPGAAARVGVPEAVHIGSLGLVLEPMASTIELIVRHVAEETLVMADLNARPSATSDLPGWVDRVGRLLHRIDVVKASVEDLAGLRPGIPPMDAAVALLADGPRVVLLTDGGSPVCIVTAAGIQVVEPPRVDVVDTVGAGDAFGGGFLAAWVGAGRGRGQTGDQAALQQATSVAVRVASLSCTRRGADPPTAAELTELGLSGGWPGLPVTL